MAPATPMPWAAAKFVKAVAEHDAKVTVTRLGEPPESLSDEALEWTVSGSSILGLMMLSAEPGVELKIEAEGPAEIESLDALEQLINARFDEEK